MPDPHGTDISKIRNRLLGERNLFSVSELFHENSRISRSSPRIAQSAQSALVAPAGFKRYIYAPRIALPDPRTAERDSIWDNMASRRSVRSYSGQEIDLQRVSDLAFYALGTTEKGARRCVPSGGGLYPLELYVVVARVEQLPSGLYHYDPRSHALCELGRVDCMASVKKAVFIPEAVDNAAAVFVLTAVFGRSKIKYGERAYRFSLLEAGHVMQNICLAATALRLGVCPVGGFIDDKMNDLLDVDGVEEAVLYAALVGSLDKVGG
ncbi:SagB/ThcOx family dehydrogenase [Mesorhizobium sp. M1076]|uniref:SagB/ThcOx family dehydrogenase n=1 Tax=Mesorhizobium sp. M1076 TaxID=2957054 RepID=UPI00333AC724